MKTNVKLFPAVSVATALLLLLAACPTWGWSETGHVTSAKIAELNLNDKARESIRKLLGPIPISHPRIATYADFVKHNPDFPEFKQSGPWHFVDIPLGEQFDPAKHCQEGQCVVERVRTFSATLADRNARSDDRMEALLFLVHLIPDLHQPLHCATRVDAAGRKDAGGNGLKVKFLGHGGNHLNLHSVWDDNLVRANLKRMEETADFANRLNAQITAEERNQWSQGTVADWVNESHKLAEDVAYMDGHGAELGRNTPNLDEAYVNKAKEVVALQLKRGGIRLAKVLNDALGQ